MNNSIVKQGQVQVENFKFRNDKLSEKSKERYITIIKNYYIYLQKNDMVEGVDSLRTWLNGIEILHPRKN